MRRDVEGLALPNQKARWSVVKVVEGWLELERDGVAPDTTKGRA